VSTPLHILVQQLLFGRTEGLTAPQLAAFVDGWSSLLDLLERPDLCLPDASDEVREGLSALAQRIRQAQEEILEDDGG
jgi:hypothetical protein